jgi:ATP-binding cassette, subfamily B, bacterial PglK
VNTARKAISILSRSEQKHGLIIIAMTIVMAAFEAVGVASIMPFLAVLGDPTLITTTPILTRIHTSCGHPDTDTFLFILGAGAFFALVMSTLTRMTTHYAINRYTQMRISSISQQLLRTYLRQPYAFFLNRHSGDMASRILSESNQVVGAAFKPLISIVANAVALSAILFVLVLADPKTALQAGLALISTYTILYTCVRKLLTRIGAEQVVANRTRFSTANEAINGIQAIKLHGLEHEYANRFKGAAITSARNQAASLTLSQTPKFAIETIAFGGIIILCLNLLIRKGGAESEALGSVLPLIGIYTFSGYKLLPIVQAIYVAATQLRFGAAAIDSVYEDITSARGLPQLRNHNDHALKLTNCIELNSVSYTYPNSKTPSIRNISIKVAAGSRIGIVGATGSGKSTLLNVILGLLQPQSGHIRADTTTVNTETIRNWQRNIGYVPQDIFLIDGTITENIAFGCKPEDVNEDQLQDCVRSAQLHTFITRELTDGLNTQVGERGVRLSGGQRQRIGIARALYNNPNLIIFDEATSALDNLTETQLMEAINALQKDHTIIMVAHRISTVRTCDSIVMLEGGRIVAHDTYDALLTQCQSFRDIAIPA